MRNDKNVNDSLLIPSQRRRRTLANITNLSLSANWNSSVPHSTGPVKSLGKSNSEAQLREENAALREENAALKRLLSEKETAIEIQAGQLDQMQKDFFAQLRRHTQVNEELILYNSRLAKDAGHLRDQLKLLQHEYCQMTVAYRINQSELQVKLAESQDVLNRLVQHGPTSGEQSIPTKVPAKARSRSAQRRHSVGNLILDDDWNSSTKLGSNKKPEEGVKRFSDFNRRSSSVGGPASKESTTRAKQTQQKAENSAGVTPFMLQHAKIYGDFIGLEPMLEDSCEVDSPRVSTSGSSPTTSNSDDSGKGGESASGLTCESHSGRQTCSSDVSAAASAPITSVKRANSLTANKINQRVACLSSSVSTPHFSRRATSSSLNTGNGRPVRRAVEKVASYTEPALNTKMRRPG